MIMRFARATPGFQKTMLLNLTMTVGGFMLLMWGADRFVTGAAGTASVLGVPPLLIGLTVVGFATSAPEIMVSVSAASQGMTGMAVGNALGSNIANVGMVLGVTALITPICGKLSAAIRKELPILVILTGMTMLLFLDYRIDAWESLVLLGALAVFLLWMVRLGMKLGTESDDIVDEISDEIPANITLGWAVFWLAVGLITLLIGSNLLVRGAEHLAITFGVSKLIIGLTIIAVGTSLPELAVSVVSALKGDTGIAVGNVIGSNVFNLLAVIGVAGLIHPADLDPSILTVHFPVMIAFTLPLLLLAYNPFGAKGLNRVAGVLLLVAFFSYHAILLTNTL